MKANEAPEKIYLEWQTVGNERYRIWGTRPITNDEPVEYTRTDAFIEKAVKYLEETLYDEVCYGEIRHDIVEQYINDFEKAMRQ